MQQFAFLEDILGYLKFKTKFFTKILIKDTAYTQNYNINAENARTNFDHHAFTIFIPCICTHFAYTWYNLFQCTFN